MFKLNIPLVPLVRVLVLAAFLVTAVQSSADAASINFYNKSGWMIKDLYITNNNDTWGPNRLNSPLSDGHSRRVNYDYHDGPYAVALRFTNGKTWRWADQSFNNASTVTIYYDGSDGFELYVE